MPSPCGFSEKCQRIGSLGYKCICDSDKTPNDCPIRKEYSVMLSSVGNRHVSNLISKLFFYFFLFFILFL